jgi:hypothetical protein
MAAKCPISAIAQSYASLKDTLPEIGIDPRMWGSKALELLSEMAESGPIFRQAVAYLIEHDIPLHITREAKGVGAGWHENLFGERWLSVDKSFGFVDSMIVIGHEIHHLQQDIRTRCSVEGEYSAWRFSYQLRAELSPSGNAALSEDEQRLASMPDNPSREDLRSAQHLMKKMAGPYYRIDLAPLQGKDLSTAFLALGLKIVNIFLGRGEQI